MILPQGYHVQTSEIHPALKGFQKTIVQRALHRCRCAVFADTGLGKGWIALEWLRHVYEITGGPVLLLAPLAVSHQFVREAEKLDVPVRVVSDASQVWNGINITNYQKLHKFEASAFTGVALDESSCLKSFDGKTRTHIIASFAQTPWRLALTATPAPNDYMELGNHAQFLGVMSFTEMLSMYFVHDGETTSEWRLKGHAQKDFWRWVSSWAITCRMPSDLGYPEEDAEYELPPMKYHHHVLPATLEEIHASGVLIAEHAKTLADQRDVRRATLRRRVKECYDICGFGEGYSDSALIFCDLNDEQDALEKAFGPSAFSVRGSTSDDEKERQIIAWIDGEKPFMVSKSSIMGFGLNLQHCSEMIFCGLTNSFESFYQSVRRVYRFGQKYPVNVHIVTSEFEGAVIENLKRKQADAERMASAMVEAMRDE